MLIYSEEKALSDIIKNNTTISYISHVQKVGENEVSLFRPSIDEFIAKSSVKDEELYFYKSILVSTTINKNDDYFRKEIVWAAKDTPSDKPVNIGHDSTKVIGHTVSSFAIDSEGKLIDSKSSIDDVPDKFHLLVGSVIYRIWHSDDKYQKSIAEIIENIEAGNLYVSQECRFRSFDYLISNEKETKLISRNKETAFLTKYLRAYGGDGKYEDYKIARAVSDISFVGKGIVDKPANPESVIILPNNDIFEFADAKISTNLHNSENFGVISKSNNTMETQIMSDNFYKDMADELKAQNLTLVSALDGLKEKLTQSNVSKLEDEIKTLTAQVTDMGDVIKKKSDELVSKDNSVVELNKKSEDLAKANDELIKLNKELGEKVASVEAEKKSSTRMSTLVAGGFTQEDAVAKMTAFNVLNDEQFNLVANELIQAKKSIVTPKNPENPSEITAEDINTAEVTDPEVASAGVSNDLDVSDLAKKLSAELKIKDGDK